MTDKTSDLLKILRDELAPALGCTEPIALAYSTASAAEKIAGSLKKIVIKVNRNIYKNGLRVGIPGTDKTGLHIAAALGYLVGDPKKELEVIEAVEKKDIEKAEKIISDGKLDITIADGIERLFIETVITTDKGKVRAITLDQHLNIIRVEAGDEFDYFDISQKEKKDSEIDIKKYGLEDIWQFANTVDPADLEIIEQGIELSYGIVEKGREQGTKLGDSLKKMIETGMENKNMINQAQLMAARGSEARMSGCKKAVMSNSGSGNQGLTAFLTVLGAAEVEEVSEERLYRSLVVSNLITIYIKSYLGVLSAMCGADVAAGTGASIGIIYLLGGDLDDAYHAAGNMLGVVTGIICDGAKEGCAYKVALAASWAVRSALLALDGTFIPSNNGILSDNFEDMIQNLGKINQGMNKVDEIVMDIMLEND